MSTGISRGRSEKATKALLTAFAIASILWLSLIGVVMSTDTTPVSFGKDSINNHGDEVTIRTRKLLGNPTMDINYMSKRRVPNGPDPIHNRHLL